MILDIYISRAIKTYMAERRVSAKDLAKKVGTTSLSINRWKKGQVTTIQDNNWYKLFPLIRPYLPQDKIKGTLLTGYEYCPTGITAEENFLKTALLNKANIKTILSEISPVPANAIKEVPVVSMASAAGFEPAFEPFLEYVQNNQITTHIFMNVKDTQVGIMVEGDSMTPVLPNGSIVLIDTAEYPQRGDIVVAWLRDHGVVIKKYYIKDSVITLSSFNPSGQEYKWNKKEDPTYCLYMKPVIQHWVDSRKQRWEKNHN